MMATFPAVGLNWHVTLSFYHKQLDIKHLAKPY